MLGVGRTGSFAANGSGDYVIAFSTHPALRRAPGAAPADPRELGNQAVSALFAAVVEATEEAIYNSLFMATAVDGPHGRTDAIPLDRVREVLKEYGVPGR
jgi:D-aminopeptidase